MGAWNTVIRHGLSVNGADLKLAVRWVKKCYVSESVYASDQILDGVRRTDSESACCRLHPVWGTPTLYFVKNSPNCRKLKNFWSVREDVQIFSVSTRQWPTIAKGLFTSCDVNLKLSYVCGILYFGRSSVKVPRFLYQYWHPLSTLEKVGEESDQLPYWGQWGQYECVRNPLEWKTILNNTEVYEEPVSWTKNIPKKIPHYGVKLEAGNCL